LFLLFHHAYVAGEFDRTCIAQAVYFDSRHKAFFFTGLLDLFAFAQKQIHNVFDVCDLGV
jgi:hypothetical protein